MNKKEIVQKLKTKKTLMAHQFIKIKVLEQGLLIDANDYYSSEIRIKTSDLMYVIWKDSVPNVRILLRWKSLKTGTLRQLYKNNFEKQ